MVTPLGSLPDHDTLIMPGQRQELNTDAFEDAPHRINRASPRINHALFQPNHGVQGNNCPIRQFLTCPSKHRPGGANLAGSNHPERKKGIE